MKNTIYLRRKNKVSLAPNDHKLSLNYVATVVKDIEHLGCTFSTALIERLQTRSLDQLVEFHRLLILDLKAMVGADVRYQAMYPNSPKQVMEMDEAELYLNALYHYIGRSVGLRIMPHATEETRPPLLENTNLKVIDLGDEDDFKQICRNLLQAKSSLSETAQHQG